MGAPGLNSRKSRRRLIVDRRLQFRFALFCVGYLTLTNLLLTVSLFGPLIRRLNDPVSTGNELFQAATQVLYLHAHYWPVIFLSIIVVSLPVIYLSRRFVGPLARFATVLEKIGAGRIPRPFGLRKEDYLNAELEVINRMLVSLREGLGSIQEDHMKLQCLLEKLNESAGRHAPESVGELSREALDLGGELGRKIERFELES